MIKKILSSCLALATFAAISLHAVTNTPPDFDLAFYPGAASQEGNGIATDSNGNIYVTGQYQGSATIGGAALTAYGSQDYYLASFDTNGAPRWGIGAGTTSSDFGTTVKLAANGDLLVAISAFTPINLHGTNITGSGGRDAILARYTTNGVLLWAKAVGGAANDQGDDLSIDSDGTIVLAGRIDGTATIGTNTIGNAFSIRHFITKFTSSGDVVWAKALSATSGSGTGVAVDGNHNIVVTGGGKTSGGDDTIMVAKYNSSGAELWQTNHVSLGGGTGIQVDSADNIYVCGTFYSFSSPSVTIGSITLDDPNSALRGFVAKYDSTGSPLWASRIGGRAYRLQVQPDGSVFTCGFFSNTSTNFDFTALATFPAGTRNAYITKHASDGQLSWVKRCSAAGGEILRSITADVSGTVHVIGEGTTAALDLPSDPTLGSVVVGRLSTNTFAKFTLTTAVSPAFGGIVVPTPDHDADNDNSGGIYFSNTVVSVRAYSGSGKSFAFWSGGASGTNNPINVTMDSDKTVTANFITNAVAPTFTLSTNVSPAGSGSIAVNPPGSSFTSNTVVTVTATAAAGKTFVGWTGATTSSVNPLNVTMDGNKSVTAVFTNTPVGTSFTLTTNVSPAGYGSIAVDPSGTTFASNTVVALTATPASGKIFVRWSGATTTTTNPVSLTMSANKSITAVFTNAPKYFVLSTNVNPVGSATIAVSPAPTTNGYPAGTVVTLTATPNLGFKFLKWTGASVALTTRTSITMSTNKTITALLTNLAKFNLNVTLSPTNAGMVLQSPSPISTNDYYAGTTVTLTPVPKTGFKFVKWTGSLISTVNPGKILMNTNKTITAVFTTVPTFQLTGLVTPSDAGDILANPAPATNGYSSNAIVGLTALANGTNQFAAWAGAASGLSNQVNVTMKSNKTVTAVFNNPGKLYWQSTNSFVSLWFMQNSNFVTSAVMNGGKAISKAWRLAGTVDFNNDGSKDLLFQNNNGAVMLWMITNNFIVRTQALKTAPLGIKLIGAGHFTTNSSPDLLWQNNASGALTIWSYNGTNYSGTQSITSSITPGTAWKAIAVADFNDDGNADIVFQHTDRRVMVWAMNSTTMEMSVILNSGIPALTGWKVAAVSDLDENGTPDILFQVTGGKAGIWALNSTNVISQSFIANGGAMPLSWTLRAGK